MHQDSGSCEASRFNLVGIATLGSSRAGDGFWDFSEDRADLISFSALRFLSDDEEIIFG